MELENKCKILFLFRTFFFLITFNLRGKYAARAAHAQDLLPNQSVNRRAAIIGARASVVSALSAGRLSRIL